MAEQAEELLAGSGWLPEPLRTPGQVFTTAVDAETSGTEPEATLPDDLDQHEASMPMEVWPIAAE